MTAGAPRIAALGAAVALGAMVATPLCRRGRRRAATVAVVAGWFVSSSAIAADRWGTRRALIASATTASIAATVEKVGTATGVPFGRYGYTSELQPQIAGVPAVIPAAWVAMAVPSREVGHVLAAGSPARRALIGAAALTAWDVFLDPQMVTEGYWRWGRTGRYRGIPASNFVGWFLTSYTVMLALDGLLPLPPDAPGDARLVATYATMAAMETLGFAAFFRDPLVAACGACAMGPLAVLATRRVLQDAHG